MKRLFKRAFIIFCSGLVFFLAAYAYLYFNFNKSVTKADQKDYTVPYETRPENQGVAFVFPDDSAVLVHLDFENMCLNLLDISSFSGVHSDYNGYTADFTVETGYELIEGIIDRVGGVSIEADGEILRYTGVQAVNLLLLDNENNIKKQIIMQIFEQISKNNFSKDDFVYIIENSKSNLSFIDCIYWLDYIKEMSQNINFIN